MYIFDEVVAAGFNTLCYDAERCRETAGIKSSARINNGKKIERKKKRRIRKNPINSGSC